MKYLRLYDLRNETVTVIPYARKPIAADTESQEKKTRKRQIGRSIIRQIKRMSFSIVEFAVSLASGFAFLYFVSERLREIRGYDAVGSEYFAAAFIAFFVFWIFEKVRFWLWTRK